MSDEFDAEAAARAATGRSAGGGAPSPGGREQASADADVDDDQGDDGDGGSAMSMGALLLPLFLAPERGPSAETFSDYGVEGGIAMVLDGITDYVLDLLGKDVDDNLGPAGKIGLGMTRLRESAAGGSSDDDDGDGDDGMPDEAPEPPGGVAAV